MTFTKTPPTLPGFYAWRLFERDIPNPYWVTSDGETFWRDGKYPATNGEWCRLVPFHKMSEEVEKAFRESALKHDKAIVNEFAWNTSRAKKVSEGTI